MLKEPYQEQQLHCAGLAEFQSYGIKGGKCTMKSVNVALASQLFEY